MRASVDTKKKDTREKTPPVMTENARALTLKEAMYLIAGTKPRWPAVEVKAWLLKNFTWPPGPTQAQVLRGLRSHERRRRAPLPVSAAPEPEDDEEMSL